MKWILIWVVMNTGPGGAVGVSSGSAEFDSAAACEAGRETFQMTVGQVTEVIGDYGRRVAKANCISSQGEKPKG
jgi:hypothetical protein